MDNKRRDFLKVAGISTLAGLGGTAVIDRLVNVSNIAHAASAADTGHAEAATDHGSQSAASGVRYGMVVDVRKFREDPSLGEKVVAACHTVHNVPEFPDKKDEIKWIWMTHFENAFPESPNLYRDEANAGHELPIFCNHCDNPPCVRVCPTKATFRNKEGIVIMDYHRCIGCRFCMAACPYGARSFNFKDPRKFLSNPVPNPEYPTRMIGVVEKCTFCAERLAVGKLPACVEAANGKILFGDLEDPNSTVRQALAANYSIRRKPSLGTQPGVYYLI